MALRSGSTGTLSTAAGASKRRCSLRVAVTTMSGRVSAVPAATALSGGSAARTPPHVSTRAAIANALGTGTRRQGRR
nr:hypothetical protein [Cupriavidus sp. AcVe19-6a]